MPKLKLPALDPETARPMVGYNQFYPPQYSEACETREWRVLRDAWPAPSGSLDYAVLFDGLPQSLWRCHEEPGP